MHIYQLPMMKAIIMYCKCVPIKIYKTKKVNCESEQIFVIRHLWNKSEHLKDNLN